GQRRVLLLVGDRGEEVFGLGVLLAAEQLAGLLQLARHVLRERRGRRRLLRRQSVWTKDQALAVELGRFCFFVLGGAARGGRGVGPARKAVAGASDKARDVRGQQELAQPSSPASPFAGHHFTPQGMATASAVGPVGASA